MEGGAERLEPRPAESKHRLLVWIWRDGVGASSAPSCSLYQHDPPLLANRDTKHSPTRTHAHTLSHFSITQSTRIFTHLVPKFRQHVSVLAHTSQKHRHMDAHSYLVVQNQKVVVTLFLTIVRCKATLIRNDVSELWLYLIIWTLHITVITFCLTTVTLFVINVNIFYNCNYILQL